MYIIAGPNGIGKTTCAFNLIPHSVPILNADEIARDAKLAGIVNVNSHGFSTDQALRLLGKQLDARHSFSMETNLCDNDTWRFFLLIRNSGYRFHLIFLSTDDLNLLDRRISERTYHGDHFVRPDIVRQRYDNGFTLLAYYFAEPDEIMLFDNSEIPTLVARIEKGNVLFCKPDLPKWISEHLGEYFQQSVPLSR